MAHFRAEIRGGRGSASRLGHKTSGIMATVNGWTAGVEVHADHRDGKDVFRVFRTGGSGDARSEKVEPIAEFAVEDHNG